MPDTTFTRQELIGRGREPPAVNQVELHPAFPNDAVLRACARHGVGVQAYSPLGCGELQSLAVRTVLQSLRSSLACLDSGAITLVPSRSWPLQLLRQQ